MKLFASTATANPNQAQNTGGQDDLFGKASKKVQGFFDQSNEKVTNIKNKYVRNAVLPFSFGAHNNPTEAALYKLEGCADWNYLNQILNQNAFANGSGNKIVQMFKTLIGMNADSIRKAGKELKANHSHDYEKLSIGIQENLKNTGHADLTTEKLIDASATMQARSSRNQIAAWVVAPALENILFDQSINAYKAGNQNLAKAIGVVAQGTGMMTSINILESAMKGDHTGLQGWMKKVSPFVKGASWLHVMSNLLGVANMAIDYEGQLGAKEPTGIGKVIKNLQNVAQVLNPAMMAAFLFSHWSHLRLIANQNGIKHLGELVSAVFGKGLKANGSLLHAGTRMSALQQIIGIGVNALAGGLSLLSIPLTWYYKNKQEKVTKYINAKWQEQEQKYAGLVKEIIMAYKANKIDKQQAEQALVKLVKEYNSEIKGKLAQEYQKEQANLDRLQWILRLSGVVTNTAFGLQMFFGNFWSAMHATDLARAMPEAALQVTNPKIYAKKLGLAKLLGNEKSLWSSIPDFFKFAKHEAGLIGADGQKLVLGSQEAKQAAFKYWGSVGQMLSSPVVFGLTTASSGLSVMFAKGSPVGESKNPIINTIKNFNDSGTMSFLQNALMFVV